MNQTTRVRQLTHSELWEIEASTIKDLEGDSKHYTIIDFMKPKPGKDAEYYKTEKELFSKIHAEDEQQKITVVRNGRDLQNVCDELGYRALRLFHFNTLSGSPHSTLKLMSAGA